MNNPDIRHGGNLRQARELFGEPAGGWQDLSTGISPWSYPVPEVPPEIWQALPADNLELNMAAAHYYGVSPQQVLPLPGSQFAIARLPHLLAPGCVALPSLGYREHQQAWLATGHTAMFYNSGEALQQLVEGGKVSHAVVINPNNPSGQIVELALLERVGRALADRQGVLLIDEAFMDLRPQSSAVSLLSVLPNLLMLRSLGKFFGLAGLRLGFLLSDGNEKGAEQWGRGHLVQQLAAELTPWGISHPAQWLGAIVLRDQAWQIQQRARIITACQNLADLCRRYLGGQFDIISGGLFVTLMGDPPTLYRLYQMLGRGGIYSRWCYLPFNQDAESTCDQYANSTCNQHTEPAWLRLGLPLDGGERLQILLTQWQPQ